MDSEELSALCSSLALEEDEETIAPDLEEGLQVQGKRSIDRSLVGCVLSTGPIARDAFIHMIKGVWKTKERFDVEAIGSNKFVFHFLSTTDRRRVLLGGPWCYQNKLLVLEEPAGVGDYSKMSFSQVPFWVQLHNIPVFCMSKAVGLILGNMVGRVQEVECNQDELCLGTFIRVRVIIDISKPLNRILKVRLGTDKELVTILLRYEHHPELCFLCGLFDHPLKECPDRGTRQGDNLKLKYGAWIKAPIPSPGEPSQQYKRRRPSLGISSHDPSNDILVPRQPHASANKIYYSSRPLPRQVEQPTHLHQSTSRQSNPTQKNYRHRGIGKDKALNYSSHTTGKLPELVTPSAGSYPTTHHSVAPAQMERLRSKLGYSRMLTWGREGRSGGLCLLWSDSITVQLLSGSKGHIDVVVSSPNSTCWHFTGLYGNPDTSLRPQFWDLMKRLGDSSSLPWLCGGDMNEILFHHEKKGGGDRASYLLRNFREAIEYCNLADLGFRGPKFTWCRGNYNSNFIQERLDRMLGNSGWSDMFPNSIVHHLRQRYWQQQSKDLWLKSGDRNSKFFHQKASARREKNSIIGLFDSNENWSKVSPAMNEQLDGPFVAEDVRAAVFQMAPSKSPGADGMSALFYQNYWTIVGDEVTTACLGFLNEGLGLGSINETLITLLPKVKCPTHITEFRPISLCNVLYKIISKMLATRMRSVMDSIISEEQSAFIPGRLISDNAIIGFECIHVLKRRRSKKKGFLALKLDMAKAYDRVEWSFIREVLKKLGFSEGWIKKILDCVTSVYYSLLLNGEKVGCIRPSRGLRQGDPLSPYLFLLCAEGLSSLIHTFERTGQLQGMWCGTNGPTISHLFFADDSLLFIEATPASCYAIKEILLHYETASGQLVNYSKSAVCFGPSINEEDIG
ncbi:hypothetical protein UlMin_020467 [Ulmus minor]